MISRYLTVSDLHICDDREWSTFDGQLFICFLDWYERQTETMLVLTGDVIEGLYQPSWTVLFRDPVVQRLILLAAQGRLICLRGNHDELVPRRSFPIYTTDRLYHEQDGIVWTHGHQWDHRCLPGESLDNAGAWFVWLLRKILRRKPDLGPLRKIVGDSKATAKLDAAASNYAARRQCILVAGHTHSPRIDRGPNWRYCNAGTWQGGRCDVIDIRVACGMPIGAVLTDAKALVDYSPP